MQHYLYIARPLSGKQSVFKVGKTRRNPATRCKELGGQSDVKFELVRFFVTRNGTLAETLAHQRLARQGSRLQARKELFETSLENVLDACGAAAEAADAAAPLPAPATVVSGSGAGESWRLPQTAFWKALAACPVTFQSHQWRLGELLAHGARNEAAARRLRALGFDKVFFSTERVEFVVQPLGAVFDFINARGIAGVLSDNGRLALRAI